jgi:hypothetical protein
MATNYPGSLDDNTTLPSTPDPFVDGVTTGHLTNPPTAHGAIKALETKVGTGTSDAAAATTGHVLTKQVGGGTAWAAAGSIQSNPRPSLAVVYATDFPSGLKTGVDSTYTWSADGTDDQVEIQAAIDAAAVTRGTVHLLGKTFTCKAPLNMKTGVRLLGEGRTVTKLRAATSGWSGTFQVKLADINVHATEIGDLWFDGQGVAVTGIGFDNTGGSFSGDPSTSPDPIHYIHDLLMFYQGGNHINIIDNCRGSTIRNIRCLGAGGDGVVIDGPDMVITDVHVGSAVGYGIKSLGTNCHYTDCKAWYSDLSGWRCQAVRCVYTGCEAQDNLQHGFDVNFGKSQFIGCMADSNSYDGSPSSNITGRSFDGFNLAAGTNILQSCMAFDKDEGGRGRRQLVGFRYSAGFTFSKLDGITYNNFTASTGGTLPGTSTADVKTPDGF